MTTWHPTYVCMGCGQPFDVDDEGSCTYCGLPPQAGDPHYDAAMLDRAVQALGPAAVV